MYEAEPDCYVHEREAHAQNEDKPDLLGALEQFCASLDHLPADGERLARWGRACRMLLDKVDIRRGAAFSMSSLCKWHTGIFSPKPVEELYPHVPVYL